MTAHLHTQRVLGYSFEDRGTFEKALQFSEPKYGGTWTMGTTSRSVILYGFARTRELVPYRTTLSLFHQIIEELKIPEKAVIRSHFHQKESTSGQRALDLAP